MSNQDFGGGAAMSNRDGLGQRTAKVASDAFSNASAIAGDAASKAKEVASETAATVAGQVRELLDRQVGYWCGRGGTRCRGRQARCAGVGSRRPAACGTCSYGRRPDRWLCRRLARSIRRTAGASGVRFHSSPAGDGFRSRGGSGVLRPARVEKHSFIGGIAAHPTDPPQLVEKSHGA